MASSATSRRRPAVGRKHATQSPNKDMVRKEEETRTGGNAFLRRCLTFMTLLGVVAGAIYFYATYFLWDDPLVGDETLHQPFKVVDLPGKGKGVIATRDIEQGELLLREKPLFVVPSKISTSPGAFLLHSLAVLTPGQREAFYDLSYVNFPSGIPPDTDAYHEELALAIFQTNSISAGSGVGIFPRMARFNHGCSSAFNSVYTWREDEGVLVAFALKSVKKGQELLTTYTDTKRPRDVRRRYLKDHYGFECQCAVCSLPDALSQESDKRLTEMSELYSRFAAWGNGGIDGRMAIETARKIWGIGEEEGYWSERGRLAADACWVAASYSDAQATREWAQLALTWYGYELGRDSEQAKEVGSVVAQPLGHRAWETREAERVGGPGLFGFI